MYSIKTFVEGITSGAGILDSFSNAFGGFGSKVAEATKEGYNLVQALDDLEDAERANQASIAETNRNVAILIAKSKDRTKAQASWSKSPRSVYALNLRWIVVFSGYISLVLSKTISYN